jgi:hypothetical protein
VGSEGIVFYSPPFDEYLRLPECVKDLSIQQFVSELTVETFTVAVFPGTPWFDIEGSYPCTVKPLAYSLGSEFRAVIRSDMFRWPMGHEEIGQAMEHVISDEFSVNHDSEALPTEFVYDREDPDGTAIMGAVLHKVIGPDMVAVGGPEPDTRPIIEP